MYQRLLRKTFKFFIPLPVKKKKKKKKFKFFLEPLAVLEKNVIKAVSRSSSPFLDITKQNYLVLLGQQILISPVLSELVIEITLDGKNLSITTLKKIFYLVYE